VRTIVTNVPAAVACYTGRIIDPQVWSVSFADALAAKLAVLLAPVLVGLQAVQVTAPAAQVAISEATTERR
jgi:hypothetical protein